MKKKLLELVVGLLIIILAAAFFNDIEALNKVPEPCNMESLTIAEVQDGYTVTDCHGLVTFYKSETTIWVESPK